MVEDARPRGVAEGTVLWRPSLERRRASAMHRYGLSVGHEGVEPEDYRRLHAWSVDDLEGFWASIWAFFDVRAATRYRSVLQKSAMPGARWFDGARLNYAEHALRHPPDGTPALIALSEARGRRVLSWRDLHAQVGALQAWLGRAGVGPGDRVAGYLPNGPEAVVAFLASAGLGAIWSQCSPDFGPEGAADRLGQFAPKVLVASDGYVYAGRGVDRRATVRRLAASLPTLERTLLVDHLGAWGDALGLPLPAPWQDAIAGGAPPAFSAVPADHPLWVLYSSGTTGPPKAIVHGHAGMLVEHLKQQGLHLDIGPGDRFFWFTTTGWMMWNVVVSALLLGATALLYDGSPSHPDPGALWRWAGEEGITYFGTSAAYLATCMRTGVRPREVADLSALRSVGSTGSPLSAEAFAWVYEHVKGDVWLASLSGGTDVCSGLLGGVPFLPVRAGEIQAPLLGVKAEAFDQGGRPLTGEVGELVVTRPMPAMPLGLLQDPDGERYRRSYFDTYPGIWRHGDWVRFVPSGGAVIQGRSDATLNRHGVRIGTAEVYRVVEEVPGVADSLVVDVERPGGESQMLLFLALAPGQDLDAALERAVRDRLREALSPRHVPDRILAVPEIPRTLNGKKVEVPVKRILRGELPERVISRDALASPASIDPFVAMARSLPGV